MIRYISTSLIVFLMTFNSMAQNASIQKNAISNTLAKYEFMLTSAPNAGTDEANAIAGKLKSELEELAKNASREDLKKEFNKLVSKIPSTEKRQAYVELLENSSKAELNTLMSNPQFLSDTFRGEGSNFTSSEDLFTNALYVLIGGVILFAIIAAINDAANHQYYYSSTISFFEYGAFSICTSGDLTWDEEDFLIDNALSKCERNAYNPETCRFSRFDIDEYVYEDPYGLDEVECRIRAVVRADK